MRALCAVFRMRFREELRYRGAVIGGVICQTFFGLILIAVYRALYDTRPQTLPLQDVVTYVWLQQAFFRMMLSFDGELTEKIRSGGIAYDLCRPLNTYAYYYTRGMAQKVMGSLLRSVPMLVIAVLLPDGWGLRAPVTVPALLCALVSLGCGLLCVCALDMISNGFTLLTLDGRGIQSLLNLLMMTFSGNILPLTLFPDSWQGVIRVLPYAQLLDAPIRIYTGSQPLSGVPAIWTLQLAWTAVLTLCGLLLWNANRKRLVLQGG
ncbi:MAG: ABC-2 family transporter protein [Clostridia bacterium]|nr:ABC-2 family transporter protein [Clostridia bacterium]